MKIANQIEKLLKNNWKTDEEGIKSVKRGLLL